MISINRIGDSITGSYGDSTFGIPFSEEVWKQMQELEEKSNSVKSVKELKELYKKLEALTKSDMKILVETECPDIFVNKNTGEFFLKVGKKVTSVPMPTTLVDRIKDSIDKGVDISPIVKLWTRWLRNPVLRKKEAQVQRDFSERMFTYIDAFYCDGDRVNKLMEEEGLSREVAIERATVRQVKITQEGLLCTYKVSREIRVKYALDEDDNVVTKDRFSKSIDPDTGHVTYNEPDHVEDRLYEPTIMGKGGDAFYCEGPNGFKEPGHFIRVGCEHRLPEWSMVNTNNNASCVKGLHVGGLSYIKGYQNEGTVTHNVFVDPMHVGAVPSANHEGDGAIRCIQYFVHSSFGGNNGSIYHSSAYAARTDEQWADMKAEILSEYGEYQKSSKEAVEEVESL